MSADKLRESSTVIALSQSRLREQVEGLLTRMNSRLVEQDPAFKKIADLLPQAVAEMKNAEAKLQKADPQGALEPEQKALQFLQQAEEEYEVQVQMQRGGGGGGGGSSAMARTSPICSSWSSTRWPTSTRPLSARSSSRPIRSSTS